jgi:hypothetical protein
MFRQCFNNVPAMFPLFSQLPAQAVFSSAFSSPVGDSETSFGLILRQGVSERDETEERVKNLTCPSLATQAQTFLHPPSLSPLRRLFCETVTEQN